MPIRKSDKLKALQSVPLFSGLSKKELKSVASLTTEMVADEGTTLVTQGELGREAMILMDGAVVVRRNGRKVAELGPGDVIGEMAIIERVPRNATAVATQPSTLLLMDAREFASLMNMQPKLAVKVLKTVARRYAELDRKSI